MTGTGTLYGVSGQFTVNGGNITVTSTNASSSNEAFGVVSGSGESVFNGGTVTVTNIKGASTGVFSKAVDGYASSYNSTAEQFPLPASMAKQEEYAAIPASTTALGASFSSAAAQSQEHPRTTLLTAFTEKKIQSTAQQSMAEHTASTL